ncbi:MAG: molecular chaperone TorD family protein [Desulfobulbaceae bacterium]|nr:molecular chaperone TorD family protein [Desulfobulbaceae bacterium]HIJ78120.1 molecular chaperone TorD family protein [Deltaproteobacteria bacterium]
MDHIGIASREQRRSDCYRFLAACFYPPAEFLLTDKDFIDNLARLLSVQSPKTATHCASLKKSLTNMNMSDLAVEHAALFVGPFQLKAPPYGSVYLEEGQGIMGKTTMAVQSIYQSAGLEVVCKEVPDHIIFELEFMSYLCGRTAELLLANEETETVTLLIRQQRDFLTRFLTKWVPQFCEAIKTESSNLFYNGVADCLNTFIAFETYDYPCDSLKRTVAA